MTFARIIRAALFATSLCLASSAPAQEESHNPIDAIGGLVRGIYHLIAGRPCDELTAQTADGAKKVSSRVACPVRIAPINKDGPTTGALPPDSAYTDIDGLEPPASGFKDFYPEAPFIEENISAVQKAIYKRIGISQPDADPKKACVSEPAEFKDRPGTLEYIEPDSSLVLNSENKTRFGGARTSFGYFIRFDYFSAIEHKIVRADLFALFSYDKLKFRDSRPPICAAEFFLFAYEDKGIGEQTLLRGLAIGSNGKLLDAVPLDLAHVKNFLDRHSDTEAVKPGVARYDQGCRECHGRTSEHQQLDGEPQHTLPFPWIGTTTKR